MNGDNPTILYGYGAYGTSIEPGFDITQLVWLRRGGIYAMAHVRGGGEKGDKWYKAGFKETKENSWKDFIACAEYLVSEKYTSREKMAAFGMSAGGITVGRAITDSPELFKAAVIQVGALNSVRSEISENTFGVSEFGTVNDSIEFKHLYHMDVYHHIDTTITYPAMLLTAAMNDSRVALWEPGKVIARLQNSSNHNLALFRIGDRGHSNGSDFINESSDIYSFLFWQLGVPPFSLKSE